MAFPIFSKRHKKIVERQDPSLDLAVTVRRRILYAMVRFNGPVYDTDNWNNYRESDLVSDVGQELLHEHGWQTLKTYDVSKERMVSVSISDFLIDCMGHHACDIIELYSRRLDDAKQGFQEDINRIFRESSLPWILTEDTIFRIDSEYMATVLHSASGMVTQEGFEGAAQEFQQARSHLEAGDTKQSIHHANLTLESTMKSILGIDRAKPGELFRKIIKSGLIPPYYNEFLSHFEQVLRSVNVARNQEKGAGHGQGVAIAEVPEPLAELVLNLCGALTVYLMRQYVESRAAATTAERDEIPF